MYSIFIAVQYLGIAILLLEIIYIYRQKSSQLQLLMLMVVVSTLINFLGYLFEMRATTQEMALQAVKFIYLGKPYIILGIFLFILQYYKVKCPGWIKSLLCLFHISITFLVLNCESLPLYYSSIDYVQEGFFPHLVLGKGPAYNLFSCLISTYLVVIVVLGVMHYRKTSDRMERKRIINLIGASVVSALGLLVYFSGITRGYDSTLPAYVVATALLFVSMLRYNLLDTMDLVRESVMDDFSDGLVVLDGEERLVYTNPVVQKIYPALCSGEFQAVIEELEEKSLHAEHTMIDGRVYQISRKDMIRNEKQYGRMYVVSDITKTYQYTAELEHQTKIAEKANQAKTDFLAKMSHEIRTPINSVLGMNEMILRECREEGILDYARNVKSSASALLSIINEILDLSKIESGKLEILPVGYELNSLLNDVVHMIFVRAKDKGLELKIRVQETLPNSLFGDDIRIRQILTNLLTNAVKYTLEGEVSLEVTGKAADGQAVLRFEVSDTGIGIREEDLPKLYASFERIEEDRNRGIEGTGLGMSIVIDLLQLMGSRLQVESVYGKGSRFWFELEQGVLDSEPVGNFEEYSIGLEHEQYYEPSFTAEDAKILLVDDNDINRSVFCNLLKQTKVRIMDVASGLQCLEVLKQEHFDMIFMDHMMPGMDGIETLHKMREMEGNLSPDAPVIILTANAVAGAKESYLEEGFHDFLSKPVVPEKLEGMLKRYLPKELLKIQCTHEEEGQSSDNDSGREERDTGLLPELEEFDLGYARMYLKDDKLIRQTMIEICHTMDREVNKLEMLAEKIRSGNAEISEDGQDTVLQQYRITVHSLKSTTASVGALLLSKLARLSEMEAIAGNISKLMALHPFLTEEMKKHKNRLKVLEDGEGKKKRTDMAQIRPLLNHLADAMEERDYDSADEWVKQLDEYEYDDGIAEQMEKLKLQVLELEADAAIETVKKLLRENP